MKITAADACQLLPRLVAAGLGRAVTLREPCLTWELPYTAWTELVGPHADPRSPLDLAALAAQLGVPAGLLLGSLDPDDAAVLNAAWKYADGAATEAALRATI